MSTETTTTEAPAFALEIYLAEDADGRMIFRGDTPARYRHVGDTLWIIAETVEEAFDEAYREANVGEAYVGPRGVWIASYRRRDRARSLSVGDAIVVNGEAGYVVDSVGFRPMTTEERDVLAASV